MSAPKLLLTLTLTLTHSLSLVLVVMTRSKEFKTSRSIHMLILSLPQGLPNMLILSLTLYDSSIAITMTSRADA